MILATTHGPDTVTLSVEWPDVICAGRRGHWIDEELIAGSPPLEYLGLEPGSDAAVLCSGASRIRPWWEREDWSWTRTYTYVDPRRR